jgi:nitrogen-specific signal transduction histidine kinase
MELIITDTGIGIPESSYNSIFDSFRQESNLDSRKYKGTGLGLAITKRLVEAMNGRISVKSEVGKGSVFTVVFSGVEFFTNNKVKKESEHLTTTTGESNANIVEDKAQNEILTADKYLKLSERMNVRLYKQWNHFHVKKPLKEVKAFAQELIKLGMENEIGFIKDYGEELYLTIENFDIEEMQIKLKEFPDLLVKLKKIPHEP